MRCSPIQTSAASDRTGFTPRFLHGDTEAFPATGQVHVRVDDFNDESANATCTIAVADVATGDPIDQTEADKASPEVELTPGSADEVYVQDPACRIYINPEG